MFLLFSITRAWSDYGTNIISYKTMFLLYSITRARSDYSTAGVSKSNPGLQVVMDCGEELCFSFVEIT